MRRGVTVVYHLAALFANQNSIDHPHRDLEVNGLGTLKLLELARDVGVDKFVFASSGCSVYGSKAPLPLTEDFVSLDLDTPYQITKLLGELYCNFFHHYYSVPVVRARFFNVYGPGEVPGQYRNVIPNFIYRAMRHEPLTVTGTGEETRDFTFVEDVVDGLLRLGARPEAVGEAVNLASGRETTVNYLAEYINGAIGNPAGVQYTSRRDWDQIVRRRASVDKARSLVGYEPKVAMSDGLDRTIAWFRENWDQIEDGARFSGERAAQAIS
jgi:nucleoside-diphosphate-sugar epimerase